MSIHLTNLTRTDDIGANCFLLECGKKSIVLDAGMHPKFDGYDALPNLDSLQNRSLSAVFVTHSHHDHIGALPVLMRYHPDTPVFMSEPTYYLADPLLRNSASIMKKQRRELGVAEYPFYTSRDISEAVKRWQACRLNQRWSLDGHPGGENEEISFQLHSAGHISGSSAVEICYQEKRILYTGDINLRDQSLTRRAELPENGIDTLIIETTRGDNPTKDYNRDEVIESLLDSINATFENGGAVLIPVFAMGKTQELLTILHDAQEKGRLPKKPIYIGALSRVFTEIYDRFTPQMPIMKTVQPQVLDGRTVAKLTPTRGHIYLISSGMMTENTLSNVLAQKVLARERDSIFFVGYADPDSPAGKLRATLPGKLVTLHRHSGDQPVLCNVQAFDLTSHATREDILEYIKTLRPRKCVLVHGDPKAREWFRQQLEPTGIEPIVIQPNETVQL